MYLSLLIKAQRLQRRYCGIIIPKFIKQKEEPISTTDRFIKLSDNKTTVLIPAGKNINDIRKRYENVLRKKLGLTTEYNDMYEEKDASCLRDFAEKLARKQEDGVSADNHIKTNKSWLYPDTLKMPRIVVLGE